LGGPPRSAGCLTTRAGQASGAPPHRSRAADERLAAKGVPAATAAVAGPHPGWWPNRRYECHGLYDLDRKERSVGRAYGALIADWRSALPARAGVTGGRPAFRRVATAVGTEFAVILRGPRAHGRRR